MVAQRSNPCFRCIFIDTWLLSFTKLFTVFRFFCFAQYIQKSSQRALLSHLFWCAVSMNIHCTLILSSVFLDSKNPTILPACRMTLKNLCGFMIFSTSSHGWCHDRNARYATSLYPCASLSWAKFSWKNRATSSTLKGFPSGFSISSWLYCSSIIS